MILCTSMSARRACALLFGLIIALLLISLPQTSSNTRLNALRGNVQGQLDQLRQAALAAYRPAYDEANVKAVQAAADAPFLVSTKAAAPPSVPTAASDISEDAADVESSLSDMRAHLESHHSPHGVSKHSSTMHFSHIYAISSSDIPQAQKSSRRQRMQQMAVALGIELTWVDATSPHEPLIKWIAERVSDVRTLKRNHLSDLFTLSPNKVGGSSAWLRPSVSLQQIAFPENAISPKWQKSTKFQPDFESLRLPSLKERKFEGLDWVDFLHTLTGSRSSGLFRPANEEVDVENLLYDALEKVPSRQLSPESIASWHTHANLLRLMIRNQDASALVLSDNVDMEWDLERIWLAMENQLPQDDGTDQMPWEMVFLGHDSDVEQTNPAYLHPLLHHAAEPQGLHAYALSKHGYTELSRILSDPWIAYQSHFDTAVATLGRAAALSVFTVDPPIATPLSPEMAQYRPQEVTSRPALAESTMERIWRNQGLTLPAPAMKGLPRNTTTYKFKSPKPPPGFKPARAKNLKSGTQNAAESLADFLPVRPESLSLEKDPRIVKRARTKKF